MNILRVEDVRQQIVKNNTGTVGNVSLPENPDTNFFAIPGYYPGPLDDVAKVNMFHSIALNKSTMGGATQFTLGVTLGTPPPPAEPSLVDKVVDTLLSPFTSSGGGGGCTTGGKGPGDPTLPALLTLALGYIGWRRYKSRSYAPQSGRSPAK